MLDTLLKIGQWQSEDVSLLETELMNIAPDSETPLVMPIVIDLDKEEICYDTDNIQAFDPDKTPKEIMLLDTFSARSHKTYLAVDAIDHLYYLEEALFGKEGKEIGDFQKHIDSNFSELKETPFYEILDKAFSLSDYRDRFDSNNLKEYQSADSKIEVVYLKIKDSSLGIKTPKPMFQVKGFKEFRDKKYFDSDTISGQCYVTNEKRDDVIEMFVDDRKRTLKMFQGTALNYVSNYNESNLAKNFQVSEEALIFLKSGDEYIRNNLRVSIANIPHLIIPEFSSWNKVDIDLALKKIADQGDLLFSSDIAEDLFKNYETFSEGVYWVNFIAVDSDGQSFKALNEIKDVSEPYLSKVIKVFKDVDLEFQDLSDVVNWQKVKEVYGKAGYFNFKTIYGLIPVGKENKRNSALNVFKAIMEQRTIEKEQLFQYFCELILCHYFERYEGYVNIRRYEKDYFGLAIRDSVFKYLAFIQVLKKLNLIDMEQQQEIVREEITNEFDQKIEDFFQRMDFNEQQKAMFFLGRMLNTVAYLQQGKNKTVIDKINYNGMDRDDIVRLRVDLFEKAKQYGKPEKVKFTDSHFGQHFNFEHWDMNPQEAVFFILTGYSFGIVNQQDSNSKNN